jgi:hypothetical protein
LDFEVVAEFQVYDPFDSAHVGNTLAVPEPQYLSLGFGRQWRVDERGESDVKEGRSC